MTIQVNTLDAVLGKFADLGFQLRMEDADEPVSLYFKGKYLTCFNQTKVTEETIQAACQEYWDDLMKAGIY